MEDDLDTYGAPPEVRERLQAGPPEPEAFLVWPENAETVEVFAACATQWRRAGMQGLRIGLDYRALEAALRMMRIPPRRWRELFDGVRVMEAVVLALKE